MKAVRMDRATARRTASGDDHDFEPAHGLPELLPAGEKILWQGSPQWLPLAYRVFHIRKLVLYFAALVVLRMVVMLVNGEATPKAMALSALCMAISASSSAFGFGLMAQSP